MSKNAYYRKYTMSNKSLIHKLHQQKKIDCPRWLPDNMCYLTVIGSRAYGLEKKDSDFDYVGFTIPPRKYLFPHEEGLILGFDEIPEFNQWTKPEFYDEEYRKEMAFTVYGIVKFFNLLIAGNPNIIESLFTQRQLVIYSNPIGEMVRSNRSLFLSKETFYKTRNYAFAQMKALNRKPEGKRLEDYNKYGFSLKFSSHACRLLDNCEQIIVNQNLDLHRNKNMCKSILAGERTLQEIKDWFHQKELSLEKAVLESDLQKQCNKEEIRSLLTKCIQRAYTDAKIVQPDEAKLKLEKIKDILNE